MEKQTEKNVEIKIEYGEKELKECLIDLFRFMLKPEGR